jgi:hypothetical protein
MTTEEHDREYRYLLSERLGMICESSMRSGGQRPATEADKDQARREANEMMDAIEKAEAGR